MGRSIKTQTLSVTNTTGQLAWQLSQYTKTLTTVMLWVGAFICGGGYVGFACWLLFWFGLLVLFVLLFCFVFFLTYALLQLKVLKQLEGG